MTRFCSALLVFILAACTCPEIRSGDFSALNSTLPAMNKELRGKLFFDEGMTDFGSYTIEQYREHVEEHFTVQSEVVSEVFECSDQQSLTGRGNTFILCLRSSEIGFVFCDEASTAVIDKFYEGEDIPEISEVFSIVNSASQ
jgi:hypothetical protein